MTKGGNLMAKVQIGGSSGGAMSDECTATLADVAKGKTAVTSDSNDEIGVGTLELTGDADEDDVINGVTFYNNDLYTKRTGTLTLTGDATAPYVYSGKTFYNTDPKNKLTGTMTVNSLLSFSVAASSGHILVASWKNPTAASGKPYSGVYIKYSTSGYPGKGGTQIYKGAGNNTTSGGTSSVNLNMPSLSTTYYFSIYPYVTCSAGELTGDTLNASAKTGAQINKTFTSSQTYTIPAGYTSLDVFCVGGGSCGIGGNSASNYVDCCGGGGGAGGHTTTKKNIAISSGQSLAITIGAGVSASNIKGKGGTSSVSRSGSVLASATGGSGWNKTYAYDRGQGSSGGSGGGCGAWYDPDMPSAHVRNPPTNGASNGGSASGNVYSGSGWAGGIGQGTTTRAFGESSGTVYAGGGGGGGFDISGLMYGGSGGSGGGGSGSGARGGNGSAATANTGSGGGGGSGGMLLAGNGGNGASGIVLLRLH